MPRKKNNQKKGWYPQPKQRECLSCRSKEVLFGGARGGGKTEAGLAWLLYDVEKPELRQLVVRRNADDLRDWIDRAKRFYEPLGAKVFGNPPEIMFPSGALIRTGHLKDENAYSKYQGHEYHRILIEELTQIPRQADYEALIASCRSNNSEIIPQILATTNPDGVGARWVKARWNIPDMPTASITTKRRVGRGRDILLTFIPSRIEDNPILIKNDPGYIDYLDSIEDVDLREAWRNGSWAGLRVKGAFYTKQLKQLKTSRMIRTVPYDEELPVYTWWDLGVDDSTAIGFFQKYGNWRMIDYYENSGEGVPFYIRILKSKGYIYAKHYAPHDIVVKELGTGKTRLETARQLGLRFETKFENGKERSAVPRLSLVEGIDAVRRRLPTLWIDKNKCASFLEALEQYRKEYNEKTGEFTGSPLHNWTSHAADMIRYWAVTPEYVERPRPQYNIKVPNYA